MIFTFDPPETGWSVNAQASISASQTTPSPPNSLHLFPSLALTANAVRTLTGLVEGQSYDVYVRVNFDQDSVGAVRLRISYNDGPAYLQSDLYKAYDPDTLEPLDLGWELRHVGTLNYTFADRPFRVVGSLLFSALAQIEVDAIYIGESFDTPLGTAEVARKWAAIDAANDAIRGINGSGDGYNTDFESRVYSRLFTPAEQGDVKRPYACVPLDQEGERLEYEGDAFTSTWRLVGHAFFDDNPETDPLNSAGSEAAAKFRDDLVRAFMADQTLGGAALNCEVTAIDTSSGVIEDGIAEVIFTIEFTQMAGAPDLSAE